MDVDRYAICHVPNLIKYKSVVKKIHIEKKMRNIIATFVFKYKVPTQHIATKCLEIIR